MAKAGGEERLRGGVHIQIGGVDKMNLSIHLKQEKNCYWMER